MADQDPCPCGGGLYGRCCGPLHRGEQRALTAEQLMRSRYSAFARGEVDYLIATHPEPHVQVSQRRRELQSSWCCWIHKLARAEALYIAWQHHYSHNTQQCMRM